MYKYEDAPIYPYSVSELARLLESVHRRDGQCLFCRHYEDTSGSHEDDCEYVRTLEGVRRDCTALITVRQ